MFFCRDQCFARSDFPFLAPPPKPGKSALGTRLASQGLASKSDTHFKNPWSHAKLFFRLNGQMWLYGQIISWINYLDRQKFWHNDQILRLNERIDYFDLHVLPKSLAYVAGSWKGAREGDTRGGGSLPLPSRFSLSRARSFLRPLLPSACYAGYIFSHPRTLPPSVSIQYLLQAWYWR